MKMTNALCAATLGLALIPNAFSAEVSQSKVISEAKVPEAQARSTALQKVPNGVVKSSELETENGRLVWSFDISRPSAKGVTEIQVDAVTGKIVSLKTETPAQEAKEARAEAKEAKSKPGNSK